MAIGSGVGAQLGIATESTYNNGVTVSRFYEFNSESTQYNKKISEGMGLRAGGQLPRAQRRVVTTFDATGDIDMDLPTRGLGLLLAHATGSFPSLSSGSFTFTLGDIYGHSFTTQVGVPQLDGDVTPKTLTGCKVSSFELAVNNGAIATGKFSIDAAGFSTATSLASASYPATGGVFHFAQGAVTLDGSAIANIKDFTLTVDNVIKNDRYNLGSAGAKSEQLINGFRKVTGKITAEFIDTTLLAKFLADTSAAINLTFNGGSGSALSITVSAAKFDADTPKVSGPSAVEVSMTFTAYDNGTDAPLTIVYTTADTTL